jgi:hypothetical protein
MRVVFRTLRQEDPPDILGSMSESAICILGDELIDTQCEAINRPAAELDRQICARMSTIVRVNLAGDIR